MTNGNSLVNLGDLSKPATVLIEKISEAIGAAWAPHQIRRVARAEADARIITAAADLEISEIQKRGLERLIREEGKRQENIESITAQAAAQLKDGAKPEGMDSDWIANFFDRSRNVSNAEMQSLWARLLAGEATTPGRYSRRTVDLIATLDKSDAALFTQLGSFVVLGSSPMPLVFESNGAIYGSHGINFSKLGHLDSLGLIRFDGIQTFVMNDLSQGVSMSYFGSIIAINFKQPTGNSLDCGHVMLTKAGEELFPICGARPDPAFIPYMLEKFRATGHEAQLIVPQPTITVTANLNPKK